MKLRILALLGAFLAVPAAQAGDLDNLQALAQAEFDGLSHDLSSALSYKAMNPTESMGITGFDIGVDASATEVNNSAAWDKATSGSGWDYLPMARLRVMKGLPLGFDVGGFYSEVPGSNIKHYGMELRYALLEGGTLTPAVGLRAATTQLKGVDQLDFKTRSLDLSISKGFGPLTPYAGFGRVWADSTPDASTGLQSVSFSQNKTYAGLRFSLTLLNIDLEADKTGNDKTYSLKFALGF